MDTIQVLLNKMGDANCPLSSDPQKQMLQSPPSAQPNHTDAAALPDSARPRTKLVFLYSDEDDDEGHDKPSGQIVAHDSSVQTSTQSRHSIAKGTAMLVATDHTALQVSPDRLAEMQKEAQEQSRKQDADGASSNLPVCERTGASDTQHTELPAAPHGLPWFTEDVLARVSYTATEPTAGAGSARVCPTGLSRVMEVSVSDDSIPFFPSHSRSRCTVPASARSLLANSEPRRRKFLELHECQLAHPRRKQFRPKQDGDATEEGMSPAGSDVVAAATYLAPANANNSCDQASSAADNSNSDNADGDGSSKPDKIMRTKEGSCVEDQTSVDEATRTLASTARGINLDEEDDDEVVEEDADELLLLRPIVGPDGVVRAVETGGYRLTVNEADLLESPSRCDNMDGERADSRCATVCDDAVPSCLDHGGVALAQTAVDNDESNGDAATMVVADAMRGDESTMVNENVDYEEEYDDDDDDEEEEEEEEIDNLILIAVTERLVECCESEELDPSIAKEAARFTDVAKPALQCLHAGTLTDAEFSNRMQHDLRRFNRIFRAVYRPRDAPIVIDGVTMDM